MTAMFTKSQFNGDISQWNTCSVVGMRYMFYQSQFNGDISGWNTSNAIDMSCLFEKSKFDRDISNWNTLKVEDMTSMFKDSSFKGNLVNWQPLSLENINCFLDGCLAPEPYWAKIKNIKDRKNAIETYHTKKLLENALDKKINNKAIIKI